MVSRPHDGVWPPMGVVTPKEVRGIGVPLALDLANHIVYVTQTSSDSTTLFGFDVRTAEPVGGPVTLPARVADGSVHNARTMAIDVKRRRLFAAATGRGLITVDLDSREARLHEGVGDCSTLAVDSRSGDVFVSTARGIARVDVETGAVKSVFPTAGWTGQIALDPERRILWIGANIALGEDGLTKVNMDTMTLLGTREHFVRRAGVRFGVGALAVLPSSGDICVAADGQMVMISSDLSAVSEVLAHGASSILIDPHTEYAYLGQIYANQTSAIAVVDLISRKPSSAMALPGWGRGTTGVGFDPQIRRWVVTDYQLGLYFIDGLAPSAIEVAHARLGGDAGLLGRPSSDETEVVNGRTRTFDQGTAWWSAESGAFGVGTEIAAAWKSAGGAERLGFPVSDERPTPDGRGAFADFLMGASVYRSDHGTHVVEGAIRAKWRSLGDVRFLGFPTSSEVACGDGRGRVSSFEQGSVWWSPNTPATEVYGAILEAYRRIDVESGPLGYPVEGEKDLPGSPGGRVSTFQHGVIEWTPAGGAHAYLHDRTPVTRFKLPDLGVDVGVAGPRIREGRIRKPQDPERAGIVPRPPSR